jgi:cyanophycinase
MSRVHLVGGGRDDVRVAPLVRAFLDDAAEGAVRLLLVLEAGDTESVSRYRRLFALAGAPAVDVRAISEGAVFDADVLDGVGALAVGGGLTPAYADAVVPLGRRVRELLASGVPYLGFSAGAAIAASHALVGGWRLDGVPIGAEDAAEEVDELDVREGLGIVDFTVDVHAAQWGTLTRLVAAASGGRIRGGVGLDEHTALVVDAKGTTVRGAGAAWWVSDTRPPAVTRAMQG